MFLTNCLGVIEQRVKSKYCIPVEVFENSLMQGEDQRRRTHARQMELGDSNDPKYLGQDDTRTPALTCFHGIVYRMA